MRAAVGFFILDCDQCLGKNWGQFKIPDSNSLEFVFGMPHLNFCTGSGAVILINWNRGNYTAHWDSDFKFPTLYFHLKRQPVKCSSHRYLNFFFFS